MTHRVALVLSLALTLALGAGVVVGRDRFFAPERNSSPATSTTAAAQFPIASQAGQLIAVNPRIVATLPPAPDTNSSATQARSQRDGRSFASEREDQGNEGDEGYEHDGEHDDD